MKKSIMVLAAIFGLTLTGYPQTNNLLFPHKTEQLPNSVLFFSPNPVHEQLTVHYDNYTDHNLLWTITDLSGRIVANGIHPANEQSIHIETGNFQKGLFMLTVAVPFGNDRKTVRFVKD